MRWIEFTSQYPNLANLLPSNFRTEAESENTLRTGIENSRTEYLDLLENLVTSTPAQEIVKNPERLKSKKNFQAFFSEMKAYIAIENWICNPVPTDVEGTEGLPDFACKNKELDIEVTRRSHWDKTDKLVIALKNKLRNTSYSSEITLKDEFNKNPYTSSEIKHNENIVEEIIFKIDSIDPKDPPDSVSNEGIEIRFNRTGSSGSIIRWSSAEKIPLDPQESIQDQIKDKIDKQRGDRPLIIFYDVDLPFFSAEELKELVHGSPYSGPEIEVSDKVFEQKPIWGDYLQEEGYIPESGKTTYSKIMSYGEESDYEVMISGDSCIRDGDEGLFSESKFELVAGVMLIDYRNECFFTPNFYSEEESLRQIYQKISNKLSLNNSLDLFR